MAKYVVFDRIEGRSVSKAVTYSSPQHATGVATRLLTTDTSERCEYVWRDPSKGEIQALNAKRLELKAQKQKLPGWVTYE